MYVTSVDFEMKILEAKGNARLMVALAMNEYLRHRKDARRNFDKQLILAIDIGILAGRLSEDPSTFIARLDEDILNNPND